MRCPLPTLARARILACCALPALAEGKGVLMLEVKVDSGHQGRIQEMLDLGEEVTVLCDVTVVPGPMTQPSGRPIILGNSSKPPSRTSRRRSRWSPREPGPWRRNPPPSRPRNPSVGMPPR